MQHFSHIEKSGGIEFQKPFEGSWKEVQGRVWRGLENTTWANLLWTVDLISISELPASTFPCALLPSHLPALRCLAGTLPRVLWHVLQDGGPAALHNQWLKQQTTC